MSAGHPRPLGWAARSLALGASLALPSLGIVQKYGAAPGVLAYGCLVAMLCGVVCHPGSQAWLARRRPGVTRAGAAMLVAALVVLFALAYPIAARTGTSDRDDALNAAVRAAGQGRYPYEAVTPLGNAVSVLPGSLLLAAPFVLAGNAAWQNLLWFPAWVLVLARRRDDLGAATAMAALTLVASPAVLQDFVTGGDLATNAIIVLAAMSLLTGSSGVHARRPIPAGLAVFAGVAFATRASFLVLVPVLWAALVRGGGRSEAGRTLALAGAAAVLLVVPVYAWRPDGFTPLLTQNKFSVIGARTAAVMPVGFVVLSVAAAGVMARWPAASWEGASAVLLALPPVVLTALLLWSGARSLLALNYAVPAAFFAVPALWPARTPDGARPVLGRSPG